MRGAAERELDRFGLIYAVGIRTAVVLTSSVVSLFTTRPNEPVAAALVIVGFALWNVVYAGGMIKRWRVWLLPADLVVVAAVCLSQVWTAVPEMRADRVTWVLVAASIIVVEYQFHTSPLVGAGATAVVLGSYLAGASLVSVQDWGFALLGSWIAVEAALGRGLYMLVRRGGRVADRQFARGEQVRREAAVASARRADESEYLAALHDTASATLLMVGAGVASKPEPWLSEQAIRDLEVISGQTDPADGEIDLLPMLRHTTEHVPLKIDWHLPDTEVTVPAVVAVALCRGAREALTNVVRHAEVDAADVMVARDERQVVVRVRDEGKGFDPARVEGHGYGVTRSLVERMARMGGRAVVTSAPGSGTEIRLEWPDDHS
jgi:signal transduction histidine kinase